MAFNSFTSSTKIESAKMNENFSNIADGSEVANVAWADFTPGQAVALGTAPTYTTRFVNRYMQVGKLVFVIMDWANSSGGTAGEGSGGITFTPPVEAANVGASITAGHSLNSTATEKRLNVTVLSSTVFGLQEAIANNLTGDDQNNAVRWVQLCFFYEAA